jgi:hypothetical protein
LPKKNLPSSFKYTDEAGDSFEVKYTIEVYFKDGSALMAHTREIKILAV